MHELATLEWAFTLAFDACDADGLSAESMSSFSAEDWVALKTSLVPSVNCLQFQYNTLELWKAGEPLPPITRLPGARSYLVWRHDLVCRYRSLEPDEAMALALFAGGESFAKLCESLHARYGEQAPMQAAMHEIKRRTCERSGAIQGPAQ